VRTTPSRRVSLVQWCRAASACTLLVVATGCERLEALVEQHKKEDDDVVLEPDEKIVTDDPAPPVEKPKSTLGKPPEPVPLTRARRRGEFLVRGTTHLGFNLDQVDGLVGVAGALEIPEWSVVGTGSVELMRDDDLETAWACVPEQFRPCAIGFHLAEPGEVHAIRLFAAASGKRYDQRARPAKVRVHTDDGWFDADLDDGAQYTYVVFGKPTKTRNLSIEFLTFHGKAKGGLELAELEVYGRGGIPRAPMVLDPEQMVVALDRAKWSKSHHGQTLGATFLGTLTDGVIKRVLPGTAIYGRASDPILLVESLASTDCRTHKGMFFLLNRNTRVMVPLGDLGSMGGQIFRFTEGNGFAGGYVDDLDARVTGVVLEDGTYQQRRTQRLAKVTGPAFLDSVGIERTPLVRGGVPSNGEVAGCIRGSDDTLAQLRAATGGKPELVPGVWMVCDLGDGTRAFLTDYGPCGKAWEISVLDGKQKVVARKQAKRKGSRLHVRRRGADQLWVEIGGADDAVELFAVSRSGLKSMPGVALSVSAPAGCRETCDAGLYNNTTPR
jgi:hypothetical protein